MLESSDVNERGSTKNEIWKNFLYSGVESDDPWVAFTFRRLNLAFLAYMLCGPAYGIIFGILGAPVLAWKDLVVSVLVGMGIPLLRYSKNVAGFAVENG